jgi:hypothetical protein
LIRSVAKFRKRIENSHTIFLGLGDRQIFSSNLSRYRHRGSLANQLPRLDSQEPSPKISAACRFTAPAAEGYFGYVLRVGIRLLFFYLVLAIGVQMATQLECCTECSLQTSTGDAPLVDDLWCSTELHNDHSLLGQPAGICDAHLYRFRRRFHDRQSPYLTWHRVLLAKLQSRGTDDFPVGADLTRIFLEQFIPAVEVKLLEKSRLCIVPWRSRYCRRRILIE